MNFGIKKAGDLDVYITQDDVIAPKLYGRDWLATLYDMSKMEDCGAVTTIMGGGIAGETYLKGFKWTGTWSLYLPKRVREMVGILDENFSPGPGDDIDLSYRIYKS